MKRADRATALPPPLARGRAADHAPGLAGSRGSLRPLHVRRFARHLRRHRSRLRTRQRALRESLRRHPDDAVVGLRMGMVALRLAELNATPDARDAVRAFRRAAEQQPTWPVAWYSLGRAEALRAEWEQRDSLALGSRVGLGTLERAADRHRRALEADPTYAPAALALAELTLGLRDTARLRIDRGRAPACGVHGLATGRGPPRVGTGRARGRGGFGGGRVRALSRRGRQPGRRPAGARRVPPWPPATPARRPRTTTARSSTSPPPSRAIVPTSSRWPNPPSWRSSTWPAARRAPRFSAASGPTATGSTCGHPASGSGSTTGDCSMPGVTSR